MSPNITDVKPLILNTYDSHGGAAIATYRIHGGLRSIGINSFMLVQAKKTNDRSIINPSTRLYKLMGSLSGDLDKIPLWFYPQRKAPLFSPSWFPGFLSRGYNPCNYDIAHLFWIANGALRIEAIKRIRQPIVWTLHDMWPFTGGCHYDDECGKFRHSCGSCPQLLSSKDNDLSRRVWKRKQRTFKSLPIVVVATSQWLASMAAESSLFKNKRIEVIPNGIDTDHYRPLDKRASRTAFHLPLEKRLILFSAFDAASDKRKGGQFLLQALKRITQKKNDDSTEIVILGASSPDNFPDLGIKVHCMGYLNDEISQILLYSAVDVLVAPSLQENLSNTVMESLLCGTPVVAFNIGGMPDLIDHRKSGYLAKAFDAEDLAKGIVWTIENDDRHNKLSRCAREAAKMKYNLQKVAHQYLSLYEDVLHQN